MWGDLVINLKSGNPYSLSMIALLFLATTIFFERMITLKYVYNIDLKKFTLNLKKTILSEDYERAALFCKSISKVVLAKIALNAIEQLETDPSKVKSIIEEGVLEILPRVEKRTSLLPLLSTLTLLIGILGTTEELWKAFHAMHILDTTQKQYMLTSSIADSLVLTGIGLIISMIILAGNQLIKAIALSVVDKLNLGTLVLLNLLAPREITALPAKKPSINKTTNNHTLPTNNQEVAKGGSEKEGTPTEGFDESSVEDIKDEEEII